MPNNYDDFEKRFSNAWFSVGWGEVEVKSQSKVAVTARKDLETLQNELEELNENINNIADKQLRLSNLAKFYSN